MTPASPSGEDTSGSDHCVVTERQEIGTNTSDIIRERTGQQEEEEEDNGVLYFPSSITKTKTNSK